MGKPIRFWANTFASLGFVRRKAKRSADSTLGRRHLTIEPLEPRQMLSGGGHHSAGLGQFLGHQAIVAAGAATADAADTAQSSSASAADAQTADGTDDPASLQSFLGTAQPMVPGPPSATLYFDPGHTGHGSSGTTASGWTSGAQNVWDTSTTDWYNPTSNTDVVWNNSSNYTAVFAGTAGTAGTVTVNAAITAVGITFNTTGYVAQSGQSSDTLTVTPASGSSQSLITTCTGGNDTIGAVIASTGTGVLTVAGSGTLTLTSANNSYSGGTTILGGTLQLGGAAGALPSTTALTLANTSGATFNLNGFTQTIASLSGGGGSGGGVTLGSGTLTVSGSASATYSGVLSGSGSLTKSGTGTLTLTGNNTYTGGTTINSGTLQLGVGGALGGALTVSSGATLNIGGTGQAVSSLSGGGTIAGSSGWLTVNGGGTYGGAFSGTVGLIKSGSGTLSLTGGSDSLGYISISGGTVNMTGADTAGSTTVSSGTLIVGGSLSVGVGGTTITGGTLQIGTGSTTGSLSGPITDNGSLIFENSTSTTFAGAISGTGSLTQSGGSGTTLTLTGNNTYTGTTTISAGTLQIGNGTSGSISGTSSIYDNGSLVFDSNMWTTCSASINGGGTLTQDGSGTLTLTGSNTYSGSTTINPYSTLQVGNGTTGGLGCTSSITNYGNLVLDTNAYYLGAISGGGGLTVSGGTVYLNAANAYSGVTIWGGATLELCGTAASPMSYNVSDSGTLAFGCSGTTTYSGVISGGGSLTQNGGTLILTGANTYSGGTTIMFGTLQIGDGQSGSIGAYGSVTDYGTLAFYCPGTTTFSGMISGGGGVTQEGTGTLILTSGTNMYTGLTTVSGGTLVADSASAISTGASVSVANGATLVAEAGGWSAASINSLASYALWSSGAVLGIDTTAGSLAYQYSIAGPLGLEKLGPNTLTLTGTNTYTGGTTIAAGTLEIGSGGSTGSIVDSSGTTITDNGNLTFELSTPTTCAAMITGSGSVTQNGSGTLTLTNAGNNYSGGTTISAGTLAVSGDGDLGGESGALSLAGGTLETTVTGVTYQRSITLGSSLDTVNNDGNSVTLAGVISGTGTLVESGGGTLALTGSNTYSDGTIINQGTLQACNASALGATTGSLNVSAGAALDLDASIGVGDLLGAGVIDNLSGSSTLTVGNNNNYSSTFSGVIQNTCGSIAVTKVGSGTLTLSGPNTYSGGTYLDGGVLDFAQGALGSGTSDSITFAGGTLQWAADNSQDISGQIAPIATGESAIVDTNGNNVTLASSLSGAGGLTKLGDGTLALTNTGNCYTGDTTVIAGTLEATSTAALPGYNSPGMVSVDSGATLAVAVGGSTDWNSDPNVSDDIGTLLANADFAPGAVLGIDTGDASGGSFSYGGTIADSANGPLGLTKLGAGTLLLAGYNTYSGPTEVASGTLQAGAEYALSPASDMIVDGGAILDMNGFDNEVNTLSGCGTVEDSASGTTVWLGVGNDTTGSTFTGTLTDAGGGTGLLGLAKLGGDTFTLAGTNAFTGPTIVEDGILNVATAFGDSPVQLAGGQLSGANAPAATSVATTVAVSSSFPTNPPVYGQSVTFYATVGTTNGGFDTPTGSVMFYDEATGAESDPITLDTNGCATWTLTNPDAEDHYIVATYTSDNATFVGGTVGEYDQTVNPAGTTTTVSVADTTNPSDGGNPGYGDQVSLTATVSPVAPGSGTPTGSVEFYDGTSDLGAGTYDNVSGVWSLSTAGLALGSQAITAVYSGDDNFSSSQSADSLTVSGDQPWLTSLQTIDYYPGILSEGGAGVVVGEVYGLDGEGFTLHFNWGDGDAVDYVFPAAASPAFFSVGHIYMLDPSQATVSAFGTASEVFTVTASVTSSDGRTSDPDNPATTRIIATDPGPSVTLNDCPADPQPNTAYPLVAGAYEAWNTAATFNYQWTVGETVISSGNEGDFPATGNSLWAALYEYGGQLTVTDGNGAYTKVDVSGWAGLPSGPPAEPVVSISETDTGTNQTVPGGSNANFDVHADAGSSQPTSSMTVFYSTMDPVDGATAYTSTNGLRQVTFEPSDFQNPTGDDWVADDPFHVATTPGIYDGSTQMVTVQLSLPQLCQIGGAAQATATIQEPQLEIEVVDVTTNTNLGQVIAGSGPVTVQLGEEIGISAYVNWGQFPVAGADWVFPGDNAAIRSYNPEASDNQLAELGVPGVGSQEGDNLVSNCGSVAFEFAAGGSQDVTLVVDGVSLTAWFNVQAPEDVTVTATPTERPGFLSVPGTQLSAGRDVGDGTAQLWMDSLVWNANTPSGWEYCFAQTASVQIGFTLPKGNLQVNGTTRTVGTYANCSPSAGLDIAFPYGVGQPVFAPGSTATELDSPSVVIFCGGGVSELFISAQTYYMARPVNAAGQPIGDWVPVAELTWSYYVLAEWIPHTDLPTVNMSVGCIFGGVWADAGSQYVGSTWSGPPSTPTTYPTCNFQAATAFPEWSARISHDVVNTENKVIWSWD